MSCNHPTTTYKEALGWLLDNSLHDAWIVSNESKDIDGKVYTLEEIQEMQAQSLSSNLYILHKSHKNSSTLKWKMFTSPQEHKGDSGVTQSHLNSSLVSCSDCSHQVSVHAKSCPQCGAPQGINSNKGNISGIHAILIILVPIVGLLMGLFMLNNPEEKDNAPVTILLSVIMLSVYSAILFFSTF